MLPFTFVVTSLSALTLFTARATGQDVSEQQAIGLFNGLTPMAAALTTKATALNPLNCLAIPIIKPKSDYDVIADGTDDLVEDMVDATDALANSAPLSGSDGLDVFLAYYALSRELRRFLATFDTKSCSTTGKACSAVPTTQTNIQTAMADLKTAIANLAYILTQFLPANWAVAISGVSEADQLFCQTVIAAYGGLLNLG